MAKGTTSTLKFGENYPGLTAYDVTQAESAMDDIGGFAKMVQALSYEAMRKHKDGGPAAADWNRISLVLETVQRQADEAEQIVTTRRERSKTPMDATELIFTLHTALKQLNDPAIKELSVDGDHKSAELIVTTDEGEFVISSTDL